MKTENVFRLLFRKNQSRKRRLVAQASQPRKGGGVGGGQKSKRQKNPWTKN